MLVLDLVETSRSFLESYFQEEPPSHRIELVASKQIQPSHPKPSPKQEHQIAHQPSHPKPSPKQEHQIAHHRFAKWYQEGHVENCSCSLLPTREDMQQFRNSLLGQRAKILWERYSQQGEPTDLIQPRATCAGQALAILIARAHKTPWKAAEKAHIIFFQILEELRDYCISVDCTNYRSLRPAIASEVHDTLQQMGSLYLYKTYQLSLRASTFVEEIETIICDEKISGIYCHCILEGAPAHAISISLEPNCFIYDIESGFIAFSNRQALLNDLQRYFAIQKKANAPLKFIGLTLYSSKKSE